MEKLKVFRCLNCHAETTARERPLECVCGRQDSYIQISPHIVDLVNHPPHYKSHPSGIECITITEHMNFNIGNAIKYLWRASDKGKTIEDYNKAIWYINREIQLLEKK